MKKTLQVYLRSLLLSGMFLLLGTNSYANHISAMDLSYTFVSSTGSGTSMSSVYLVTVTIFGNCSDMSGSYATLPTTSPQVCVYNGSTLFTTLNLALQGPGRNVTNVCPADTGLTTCSSPSNTIDGNAKYVYQATVTLTGTSSLWRFIYQGYNGSGAAAGRSSLITTLGGGSGTSVVYLCDTLNNTAAIPYNTSTDLPEIPTPYYCLNEPDNYNPGANNVLGDSLVFQLVTPRVGSGSNTCSATTPGNVTYAGGVSATNPIQSTSSFTFSSTNGQMSFVPTATAVSVVDYNIREFRNGVFVGNCMREMNIAVKTCTAPAPVGAIRTPTNGAILSDSTTFESCVNSGVFSFTIAGYDADPTVSVTMTPSNLPAGSTYSIANNNTTHPVATFTWTSTGVTPGTYPFNILFSGNTCPVTSSASLAFNVIVEPNPTAILGTTTICSGNNVTLSDALTGGTWSSSNTSVATAGTSSGTIYGVSGGTSSITYSYSAAACSVNTPVTVNGPAAITGTRTVCPTLTTTLADATTGGVWSSSNTARATVSSTGVVTGVSGGTVNITYTQSSTGCYVIAPVTVTAMAAITPASSTVCIGNTIALTDATTGGIWSSSSTALATVSSSGTVGGVSAGTVNIFYTVGSCYSTATVSVSATGPAAITPSTAVSTCVGGTVALSDVSTGGTWSSSTTGVAQVNSTSGLVTGMSAGAATISYFLGGCYVVKPVTIIAGIAAITPATSTICIANNENLTETTTGGTWSSNATAVATVGPTGTVYGASAGTALISYSVGSCSVSATVTVQPGPQPISPTAPVICRGTALTFTDVTTGGTWSSNATAVATVNAAGSVNGVSVGTAIISYSVSGGCAATVVTTVVASPAAILPATALICTGNTTTLTESVTGGVWSSGNTAVASVVNGVVTGGTTVGTATISYSSGTCVVTATVTVNLAPDPGFITGGSNVCVGGTTALANAATGGTWSSSATSVATVNASGVVSGVSAGTATISYSKVAACGTVSTTHLVTVSLTPSAGTITGTLNVCAGTTTQLADAVSGGTWSVSNTNASINSTTGLVTGVTPGTTTVTYTITSSCGTVSTSANVTVGAFLSAGTITGSATSICGGTTLLLSDATTGGTWSATNTSATVSSTGLVTGSSDGGIDTINYTVTSSCGAAVASYVLTINAIPAAAPIVGSPELCLGSSVLFTDATSGGVWSASNTNVTVTTGGSVTGAALGTSTVSYTVTNSCGTSVVTFPVTVSASVSAGTITGSTSALCIGSTVSLTDLAGGGVWSSTNSGVATITTGGLVTGLSTGSTTISYTVTTSCGTAAATYPITVSSSISGAGTILGPSAVCVGSLISLTNSTGGGAWSSSNAHATITTGGAVTGISPGLDTISYTITSVCGIASTTKIIAIEALTGASTITGPTLVCVGSSITLGDAITGGVWTSGNTNATVNPSSGVVTGVAAGAGIISYTVTNSCGTISTSVAITVGSSSSAGTISGPDSVCLGSTITLVDFAGGGVWSSGNTNATITTGGVVTGAAIGTAPITYTVVGSCGTSIATKIIRIVPAPVSGTITGPSVVCVGAGISLVDAAPGGIWVASNPRATVVAPGVIDGVSPGIDTIFYVVSNSCGSSTASKIITVLVSPVVTPLTGPTHQCTGSGALILLLDGTPGGVFTSSNTSIATVNSVTGVVEGLASGVAVISYTLTNINGCSAIATSNDTVTTAPPVLPISGSTTACIGSTITLSDATPGGAWSSSNASVATVDPVFGVVTGVSGGTAVISYSVVNSCGISFAILTETISPLPFVAPIGGLTAVCIGSTITLTDATTGGTWSSDNTAIATVDPITGVVSGVSSGPVNINYNYTGVCPVTVSTTISVLLGPAVAPITGTNSECISTSTTLFDGTPGGVWSSSNTAIASVDPFGVVTGITPGTAIIYYTVTSGCATSATIVDTVFAIPVAAPITGATPVCAGSTMSLSNTSPFGIWTSGNTSVAVVDPFTGIVTGVSSGTAMIYYTISNICGFAIDSTMITISPSPVVSGIVAAFTSLCAGTTVHLTDATTGGVWSSTNTSIATVNTTGLVTGLSSGTDTILYTLSIPGGCTNSAMISITVGGSATAGAIIPSGSVTLCHGHTVTMHITTAGTGVTYQWLLNGGALAGATDVNYTATSIGIYSAVIDNGICSGTIPGPTVVSPPNPIISFTPPNTLFTGSFPAYQWFVNGTPIPGANGSSIHAVSAGTYKVVVTDFNGCSDTSGGYVVTGPGVNNVNGVTNGGDVKVYPNPATSVVRIDAPVSVNVSIVSIDGKVLISKKDATSIDVSQLAGGMYMIMVYDQSDLLIKAAKFAKVE